MWLPFHGVRGVPLPGQAECTEELAKKADCFDACLSKIDCDCMKDPTGNGCDAKKKPYHDCVQMCATPE